MTQAYIVLWRNGGRIGSVECTDENRAYLQDRFHLSCIQIDVTGTEHYSLLGQIRGKR